MDFVDWRKVREQANNKDEEQTPQTGRGPRRPTYYVEEMIRDAQKQGKFDNLEGAGKPLHIEENPSEGDNSLAYHLLKNNDLLPPEIELTHEIDDERKRIDTKLARVLRQGQVLRERRFALGEREKRAFNANLANALREYEQGLRSINSKTLTLNIIAPSIMHRPILNVQEMLDKVKQECPPFRL
jgi:hypothetical protein